jgi:hypothetical protein
MSLRAHAVGAIALAAIAALCPAGPLNPPAGAVAPAMKTLSEVEPRTAVNATNTPGDAGATYIISAPGSYYLTGNLVAPAGKYAVRIASSNVTLDLSGFTVSGGTGANALIYSGADGVTVKNGKLIGGPTGVNLYYASHISGLTISGCTGWGILAAGRSSVSDCSVSQCSGTGINLSDTGSVVERCRVSSCGATGIFVVWGCSVVSCTSMDNTGPGISFSGTARDCSATNNGAEGFVVTNAGIAESCTSQYNTGSGFKLESGAIVRGCSSQSNGSYGYVMETNASLVGCSAAGNAVSAVRVTGPFCVVEGCTLNCANGFPVVSLDAVSAVRIERNSLYQGTYAVSASAALNSLIVGNQCVGNTSGAFNVNLANNQVGPTVSAGGTIASTSPWANFVR